MTKPTIETAREIESLLGKVLDLASGTKLIPKEGLRLLKIAHQNVIRRFYKNKGEQQ